MKNIRQVINGYHIPAYMEDILTHNYCPNFLRMSMVKEKNDYTFNYQTERFRQLDIGRLDIYRKTILLRSIILLNERNEDWLIQAESYLLEPELIYTLNNCVEDGCVRVLFYPDKARVSFKNKIMAFAEKLYDRRNREECDMLEKFLAASESGDWNRIRLFLDKNILRMETRMELKAG